MRINGCPFSSSAKNFQKISKNLPNFQIFLPVAWATDLFHPSGQSTARIGSLCSGIGPEPAQNKKIIIVTFQFSVIWLEIFDVHCLQVSLNIQGTNRKIDQIPL
jgi:hypothetical protein